jgi:inner membrane protein COX18
VDRSNTLPIILGYLTLANVESSDWFMTKTQRHKKAMADAKVKKAAEAGKIRLELGKQAKSVLRCASVVRILIAYMMPGVSHFV